MEYELKEINDLREVECFSKNISMYISLYPDSSKNHLPYFVVSDGSHEHLSSKIARIRLDKPEYVYKLNDDKPRWILTENELKEMINLLKKINTGYVNNPDYYHYMLERYNGLCYYTKSQELNIKELPNYMELLNEC